MNIDIAIVGVNGKMGKWFANYFHKMGFKVKGFDTNNEIKEKFIEKANSLVSCILQIDYVLLCTPTKNTPEIIRLISKEMKRGSYLIEISSHKSKTAQTLLKTPSKINPICIHPMFGPGSKNITGKNVIIVPIKDAQKELTATKLLFPGANFVTIDAIEHDKKIAVILGLTHLVNIAFANILAKDDKISLTEKMSGSTFKAQKIISESILTESAELIETIISNPEATFGLFFTPIAPPPKAFTTRPANALVASSPICVFRLLAGSVSSSNSDIARSANWLSSPP